MIKYYKTIFTFVLLTGFFLACEDEKFEPATITFYPNLQATTEEPNEGELAAAYTVTLKTSRVLLEESQVNIRISGNGAGYGYSYVTEPAQLEPGLITLTLQRGQSDVSFKFTPMFDGLFEPRNYAYTFAIESYSHSIRSTGQKHFSMQVEDNTKPFVSINFDAVNLNGFTEQKVVGPQYMTSNVWASFSSNHTSGYAEGNAYNKGSGTSNAYLVLNTPIDGNQYSVIYVQANVQSYFSGNGTVKFKYSTNYSGTGDPEAGGTIWHDLPDFNNNLPEPGSKVWKTLGSLIENFGNSQVYIAVQHTGGSGSSSSSWRIDDFIIKGK